MTVYVLVETYADEKRPFVDVFEDKESALLSFHEILDNETVFEDNIEAKDSDKRSYDECIEKMRVRDGEHSAYVFERNLLSRK